MYEIKSCSGRNNLEDINLKEIRTPVLVAVYMVIYKITIKMSKQIPKIIHVIKIKEEKNNHEIFLLQTIATGGTHTNLSIVSSSLTLLSNICISFNMVYHVVKALVSALLITNNKLS